MFVFVLGNVLLLGGISHETGCAMSFAWKFVSDIIYPIDTSG